MNRDAPTPVTWSFLGLCLLVTVPSLLVPGGYELLGGLAPRTHAWQPFTAAFEHGGPGFPGVIHLGLNAFLIVACGRPCERLLGSGRFLVLGLAALVANAANLFHGVATAVGAAFAMVVARDRPGPGRPE